VSRTIMQPGTQTSNFGHGSRRLDLAVIVKRQRCPHFINLKVKQKQPHDSHDDESPFVQEEDS